VHWNEDEATERAALLGRSGHRVEIQWDSNVSDMSAIRANPPDAVVIDLRRLPSQGRGWATVLRQSKKTRFVPLIFVEGDPQKTERVRAALPDATFTPWSRVRGAVRKALRRALTQPVVPDTMDGYSGTPLPKKLGVKPSTRLTLLDAPSDFERTLGFLPDGVAVRRQARGKADVALLFVTSQAQLLRRWDAAARVVDTGGRLWIVWPKKSSGFASDLGGNEVRAFGLIRGWVDFKIAAIDATWSGLCFSRRADGKKKS
jgi:CheY-like chemotaxis protein